MTDDARQDGLERELSRRFRRLRDRERLQAPPFPVTDGPAPVPAPVPARAVAPGVAAVLAAAIVLAVMVLPARQSPGALYLEVIGDTPLLTDGLLEVSGGLLPEQDAMPYVHDPAALPAGQGLLN